MAQTNFSVGIGLPGLLTILFVGLKLTGFITWSWWWVLAPAWIPFLLIVAVLVLTVIVAAMRTP